MSTHADKLSILGEEVASVLKNETPAMHDGSVDALKGQTTLLSMTAEENLNRPPIMKLNLDILFILFEICNEVDWKCPLSIAAVCQVWREVVLTCPRAWTFLGSENPPDGKLIKIMLSHSGQCLVHVGLAYIDHFHYLFEAAHRVACLSIPTLPDKIPSIFFSALKRLKLSDSMGQSRISDITVARFPCLQELEVWGNITGSFDLHLIGEDSMFPPLQALILPLDTADHDAGYSLLRCCYQSLISLVIIYECATPQFPKIRFPRLRYLQIYNFFGDESVESLDLITPTLTVYEQVNSEPSSHILHHDVGSVQNLRLDHVTPLAPFTSLRVLQLMNMVACRHVLARLKADERICPQLQTLEILWQASDSDMEEIERDLKAWIQKSRHNMEYVISTSQLHTDIYRLVNPEGGTGISGYSTC